MPRRLQAFTAVIVALLMWPTTARGQTDVGPYAGGSVSISGELAGVVGYHVDRRWAFEVETTYESGSDRGAPPYPARSSHMTTFTPEVRMVLPASRRFAPYLVGGGGISSETVSLRLTGGAAKQTTSYLTLAGGGGVAVMVTRRISVDPDVRAFFWQGRGASWLRLAVGATYRF